MLVIRFQRVGRTNDPAFRIVVTEKRSKPKSGEHEVLGNFYPKTKAVHINAERVLYWLSRGAHASPRVHNLLVSHGIVKAPKINVVRPLDRGGKNAANPPGGAVGVAAPAA